MLKEIPYIRKGLVEPMYITEDGLNFLDKGEAEWHEYTVCELKGRKIKVKVPEHELYTFKNVEEIERYLEENYGHTNYVVDTKLGELELPNSYVLFDKEEPNEGTKHHITLQLLEDFKLCLIEQITKQE